MSALDLAQARPVDDEADQTAIAADSAEGGKGSVSISRQIKNVGTLERALSIAGGTAMAAYGLARGKIGGAMLMALGGGLVYRGITGYCGCYQVLGINTAERHRATAVPAQQGCKLERSITIDRSPNEIYRRWRELDRLPEFMTHLKSVRQLDEQRSHWVAQGAFGRDVEWDAEIITDRPDELIAWRSLPGGDVETAGSIRLRPLAYDRGTEVAISMKYNPPGGKVGAQIASWLGDGLEDKLDQDLRRFKQVVEAGEIATAAPQPVGA